MKLNKLFEQDFSEYLESDGLQSSTIKDVDKSLKHFKYNQNRTKKATASQKTGTLLHCLVLEPETFKDKYLPVPEVVWNTKVAKANTIQTFQELLGLDDAFCTRAITLKKDEFLDVVGNFALNDSKELLTKKEYSRALAMMDSVHSDKECQKVLTAKSTITENSLFWKNQQGTLLKERPDIYNPAGILLDVKSTCNIEKRWFMRDVEKFGYDLSLAHYTSGLEASDYQVDEVGWIVVENSAPYDAYMLRLPVDFLRACQNYVDGLIKKIECARATDYYPGVGEGMIDDMRYSKYREQLLGLDV